MENVIYGNLGLIGLFIRKHLWLSRFEHLIEISHQCLEFNSGVDQASKNVPGRFKSDKSDSLR